MLRKLALIVMAVGALFAGLASQRWYSTRQAPLPVLSEPALVDLDGHGHTLTEWSGKVVVLNFWATWCPPCREEMPEFSAIQQELGGRGLQFVGVAIDDPAEVRDFLRRHPVNYPILVGDDKVPAWADSLGNEVSALPFSVILDRGGRVVYAHTGLFRRNLLLERLEPLLAPPR